MRTHCMYDALEGKFPVDCLTCIEFEWCLDHILGLLFQAQLDNQLPWIVQSYEAAADTWLEMYFDILRPYWLGQRSQSATTTELFLSAGKSIE